MRITAISAACLALVGISMATNVEAAIRRTTTIQAQGLAPALETLAKQRGFQILYVTSVVNGVRTDGAVGEFTDVEAIEKLLSGTGLTYRYVDDKTVMVLSVTATPPANKPAASASGAGAMLLAQSDTASSATNGQDAENKGRNRNAEDPSGTSRDTTTETRSEATPLNEVLVTGTHIRGAQSTSSPLVVFNREDIERTGYTNVSDFMASIPQNFAGVSGGTNYTGRANDAGNAAYGTAVDLRGLGGDTTLVLVNGHRLAASGYYGAMTDVSVIPLSAIERVEILTDGASAIYGSDAVGGVVNYILRDDFVGSETSLLYGAATGNTHEEYRATQTLGTNWTRGNALLSYEYFGQEELRASDRSFASGTEPADLTPKSRQHSGFLAASQSLSEIWQLRGEAFFTDRDNDFQANVLGASRQIDAGTQQYSLALDNNIDLTGAWDLKLTAGYAANETSTRSTSQFGPGGADSDASLLTLEAQVNGRLGVFWGNEVRTAIGTQYRSEDFERVFDGSFVSAGPNIDENRTIHAVYAEVAIPFVGDANRRRGIERLEVNLAGRYERYSDFGSTFDPKLGVSWQAAPGFRLRGTVGTSFKAPNFQQLLGGGIAILENSVDPLAPTGSSPTLVLFGQNPDLDAQESEQWTAGLDIVPTSLPGFEVRATYFDIDFEGRIAAPGIPELDAASRPEDQDFMIRDPSLDEVNGFVDAVGAANFFDITVFPGFGPPRTLADVTVIADGRVQNIASTDMRGLDLAISYEREASQVQYEYGVTGTYLFEFENLARSGAVPVSELNRLGHPVELKLRGDGTVRYGSVSATLAVNHIDDYTNETALPVPVRVDSWTTVDLQLRYLSDWDIALSFLNVLDKEPPFVESFALFAPIGYDPANANPFGRSISLQVKRRW